MIDVAREHRTAPRLGGRDGKHAAAGADIENAARAARFAQTIEREQTPARRAVMAGAECQRRFDFNADTVDGNAGTVMAPVHDEAAGHDGLQPREACGYPITLGQRFERKRVTGGFAGEIDHKIANICLIRSRMKIYSDCPVTIGGLGCRQHHIAMIKFLNQKITQPVC